jgi:superfamily II DNA/RNA helicase
MEAEVLTSDMWTSKVTDPGTEDTPTGEDLAPGLADDIQPEDSAKTFRDLGVTEPICAALEAAGIITAFPIQALALPIALDGYDLIGQARTGTGKTLAFGIPLLQRLGEPAGSSGQASNAPRALVVVPTRELAIQVAEDLAAAGSLLGIKVVTLYGGRAYEPQIEALARADLVVGTPGRLLDLSRQRHLDLSRVTGLVLDEADKMLDLGFLPDVEKILALTPAQRQTMLFSATMPGEVVTLARRHLHRPTHVRAEQHDDPVLVPSTEQHVFRAHEMDKVEVLARVLQAEGRGLTIVFSRTKRACDHVVTALTARGFAAGAVHGDLGQGQRERAMRAFRAGKVDVLVATDVAARGLDVDDVTHVINLECPEDDKAYLHRIGRTGRAGRTGVAVTFVDWRDLQRWKLINDALDSASLSPPRRTPRPSISTQRWASPGTSRARCRGQSAAASVLRPRRSRTSARPAGTAPASSAAARTATPGPTRAGRASSGCGGGPGPELSPATTAGRFTNRPRPARLVPTPPTGASWLMRRRGSVLTLNPGAAGGRGAVVAAAAGPGEGLTRPKRPARQSGPAPQPQPTEQEQRAQPPRAPEPSAGAGVSAGPASPSASPSHGRRCSDAARPSGHAARKSHQPHHKLGRGAKTSAKPAAAGSLRNFSSAAAHSAAMSSARRNCLASDSAVCSQASTWLVGR